MVDVVPPVDTSVAIPPSVQRQIDAVATIHRQAYGETPDTTPQPPAPKPLAFDVSAGSDDNPPQPPAPDTAPQPPAPPVATTRQTQQAPIPESGEHGSWEHRYLAMKGRFDQSQTTIGSMQEQMSELGDELVRTQNQLLRVQTGVPQAPSPQPPQPRPSARALTEEDTTTYGPELISMIQRAARDAVGPDLAQVTSEVRQTKQQVTQTAHHGLYGDLDRELPDWRNINVNPRFKVWCSLRDVYSGQIRGKLLNAAFQAADAPRVIAFFKGFLDEEQATGQSSAPQPQPPADVQPAAPREPAVSLDTLAAPGRAKPATGGSPSGSSADKPVYTRAQIAGFYTDVRKGVYMGRDTEKLQLEQSIFAAQRDGRVR